MRAYACAHRVSSSSSWAATKAGRGLSSGSQVLGGLKHPAGEWTTSPHRRDHFGGAKTPVFASGVGTELIRGKVAERVPTPAAIGAGFKSEETVVGKDGKEKVKVRPASLLFDAGRNIKQVQEWLGHADPGFTLRTYVHLLDKGVGDADFFDAAVAPAEGEQDEG